MVTGDDRSCVVDLRAGRGWRRAEQKKWGRGESRERPRIFGQSPGGEAVKPSGWSSLGKAKMMGAGQFGQRPHSLAARGVAEGQCGRGRVEGESTWAGSGRRRGLLEAGGRGLADSFKGGGQQPSERGGALGLGNPLKMRAGLTRQGRGVVPCADSV